MKRQRKIMHKAFGVRNIPTYHPLLETGTHSFLRRLIADPSNYVKHTRRYAGSLTLSVVYGYEPAATNDKFLDLAGECVDLLANRIASGGGIWPVDIFPSLQHIPTWFPGAAFKRNAIVWKAKMEEFVDKPYEFVKSSMVRRIYLSNICARFLRYCSFRNLDITSHPSAQHFWTIMINSRRSLISISSGRLIRCMVPVWTT